MQAELLLPGEHAVSARLPPPDLYDCRLPLLGLLPPLGLPARRVQLLCSHWHAARAELGARAGSVQNDRPAGLPGDKRGQRRHLRAAGPDSPLQPDQTLRLGHHLCVRLRSPPGSGRRQPPPAWLPAKRPQRAAALPARQRGASQVLRASEGPVLAGTAAGGEQRCRARTACYAEPRGDGGAQRGGDGAIGRGRGGQGGGEAQPGGHHDSSGGGAGPRGQLQREEASGGAEYEPWYRSPHLLTQTHFVGGYICLHHLGCSKNH